MTISVVSYITVEDEGLAEYNIGDVVQVVTLDEETYSGEIDDITEDQLTIIDSEGYITIDIDNIDKILP